MRSWRRGGAPAAPSHRSGHRSAGAHPWRDVTVAAQHCVAADVAAKAALLLGAAGPSWLDRRGLAGRFVDGRGAVQLNETLARAPPPTRWRREPGRLVLRALRGARRVPAALGVGGRSACSCPRARASSGRASRSRSCTASSRSSPASSSSLHGGSLLLDRVVPISLAQVLVPFASPYRPFAVGLGVTAAELMAAVGLTNLVREQLPQARLAARALPDARRLGARVAPRRARRQRPGRPVVRRRRRGRGVRGAPRVRRCVRVPR